ncbi:MAG TPA: NAD(P)/FAD-dependent oxidoreductase [Acidimicrobiia bacterium]|nr:NAD(P)/FAD-dependent oxidoreductase [Acidimicrobiia bacterium]
MTARLTGRRRVVIVGAGPGGLCLGIKLRAAGHDDFVILEQAAGVGGTWRHNTYPGAACDVPSHLYSFSFEPKVDWTRAYATQPEILEYFEHCATKYDLRRHLRLETAVRGARWDDERARWTVRTDGGDLEADVLVSAVGMFNEPSCPDIPGLDTFAGTRFHSARWDHEHDLTGERVAVVGTAASAVQLVPTIAERVARLYLFQRSPQWVSPKADAAYDEEQLEQFRADPSLVERSRAQIFERIDGSITFSNQEMLRLAEAAGLENLSVVEDPELRRKLTPTSPFGCHRPLISNDYYRVFNLPHVELVTDPIARVDPDAIVTDDGRARAVDTIITATGFATTRYLSVIDVVGRDGVRLDDAWRDGAYAYLGITTPGFPNLFMLYGPNTNNGSILYMLECQADYVVRLLDRLDVEHLESLEVSPDVVERYNAALQHDLDGIAVWQAGCHGYYRGAGGRIVTQWPHSMSEYRARTLAPDPDAFLTVPRKEVERG